MLLGSCRSLLKRVQLFRQIYNVYELITEITMCLTGILNTAQILWFQHAASDHSSFIFV